MREAAGAFFSRIPIFLFLPLSYFLFIFLPFGFSFPLVASGQMLREQSVESEPRF